MAARRRVWTWLARAAAALIVAGLAVYLYVVGLDKADKLASALSLVVALVVLVGPLFRRRPVKETQELPAVPAPRTRPVSETAYLEEVRSFVPAQLLDRDAELARLAAFCSTDDPSYWRWVADAWSGKTALLAWFVLHPPQDVDVVSFFINSRFNPHNNRDAFIEAVTEQLDALLGTRSSYADHGPIRARHVQARLTEAAEFSRRNGRRLVLVVDGLDEDRGITIDSETYTIAALLPADPAPGLKVIVAGRSHPPLPPEVGADHPLRSSANIHELKRSVHAQANEAGARLELRRLLGMPLGRDLVGVLVAAGGGLTVSDVAVLTGHPRHAIAELVESSLGRTFVLRPGRWRHDQVDRTLTLAHDGLRLEADRALDPAEHSRHRESLIAWADRIASDGWPADTSEYLLRGYQGLLAEAGDVERIAALALDDARRIRLLTVTGGDDALLVELDAAAELLLARQPPELRRLARLAVRREQLEDRNQRLPDGLPALWVRLGDDDKAGALARSYRPDGRRSHEIMTVADQILAVGDAARIERLLRASDNAWDSDRALAALLDKAVAAADQALIDKWAEEALAALPKHAGVWGPHPVAAALVRAGWGHDARVRSLLDDRSDPEPGAWPDVQWDGNPFPWRPGRIHPLIIAADEQYAAGNVAAAWALADDASAALVAAERAGFLSGLSDVAELHGRLGHLDGRRSLIDSGLAFDPFEDGRVVREQVTTALLYGLTDAAHDQLADELLDSEPQDDWLVGRLAVRAAQHGRTARARSLIDRLPLAWRRIEPLSELALRLAGAGEQEAAQQTADEGWALARAVVEGQPDGFSNSLGAEQLGPVVGFADVTIGSGRPGPATEMLLWIEARATLGTGGWVPIGLWTLVEALTRYGDAARTREAVQVARLSGYRERGGPAQVDTLLAGGFDDLAEALCRRSAVPATCARMLASVVRYRNEHERSDEALAAELRDLLNLSGSWPAVPDEPDPGVAAVLALAAGGDYAFADRFVRELTDADLRRRCRRELAVTAAEAGRSDEAERMTRYLDEPSDLLYVEVRTAAADASPVPDSETVARLHTEIRRLPDPDEYLQWLVDVYLRTGRRAEARAVAATLASRQSELAALSSLLADAVRTGDHDLVSDLLADLTGSDWRREAGLRAGRRVAAGGDYRGASVLFEQTGGTPGYYLDQAEVDDFRLAVVQAAVRAGDLDFGDERIAAAGLMSHQYVDLCCVAVETADGSAAEWAAAGLSRAVEMVQSWSDPEARARAWARISDVAEPGRARELLARALVEGPWYLSVGRLARVDPAALEELADAVIAALPPAD